MPPEPQNRRITNLSSTPEFLRVYSQKKNNPPKPKCIVFSAKIVIRERDLANRDLEDALERIRTLGSIEIAYSGEITEGPDYIG